MRCPNCGTENSKNAKYCESCGTQLKGAGRHSSGDAISRSNSYGRLIGIIAVLLIVVGSFNIVRNIVIGNHAANEETADSSEPAADTGNDLETTNEVETNDNLEKKDVVSEDDSSASKNGTAVNIPMGAVTFQNHSYYIFENNCSTWEKASDYCKSRGGYLAIINSKEEDDFLFAYMLDSGRSEVYFGLSDKESEGNWKWVDNSRLTYQNWGINDEGEVEPNDDAADENYAELDASMVSGYWNDCGFGRDTTAYICEWDQ